MARILIVFDIEEGHRLVVKAELGPGEDFKELLEGAEPARQRDEAVGQLGHARLPGVHRINDFEAGEAFVADFPFKKRARDHPHRLAAGSQAGIGDDAHQAHVAATVNQLDAPLGKHLAEGFRRRPVSGVYAGADSRSKDAPSSRCVC